MLNKDEYTMQRLSAAEFAERTTITDASEVFKLSDGSVCYWKHKRKDPTFHQNSWGSSQNAKFTEETQHAYENVLLLEIQAAANNVTVCNVLGHFT